MTDVRGVAAVSRTIAYVIGVAVRRLVPDAELTMVHAEDLPGPSGTPRVNLLLVQVEPAASRDGDQLPVRDSAGTYVQHVNVPLELRYLITFLGSAEESQLMVGATEMALRQTALLDPMTIRQALADDPQLASARLDDQQPPVRLSRHAVSLDDMARLWSGFFDAPYRLSMLCEASPVIIEQPVDIAAPVTPVAE